MRQRPRALCSRANLTRLSLASLSLSLLSPKVERDAARKMAVVYDEDALHAHFEAARDAFPPNFKHALAMKSAPMAFVLDEAVRAGLGVECASFGEAAGAIARGCPPEDVVFDSPAKTTAELRWALELGITVNADSLDELERIDTIHAERADAAAPASTSSIGLRVVLAHTRPNHRACVIAMWLPRGCRLIAMRSLCDCGSWARTQDEWSLPERTGVYRRW